jgi:hypothetical protein
MHPAVGGQSFNSHYFLAIGLDGQNGTGFYGPAIQQYRTCPATAGVATDMRSGQIQDIP